MSEHKFSKGPWTWTRDSFGPIIRQARNGGHEVAQVEDHLGSIRRMGRVKANAYLISASPDMHRELGKLVNYVESMCDSYHGDNCPCSEFTESAKAALAKAEGREYD